MEKMRVQLNGISRLRLWGALSFGFCGWPLEFGLRCEKQLNGIWTARRFYVALLQPLQGSIPLVLWQR